MRSARAALVGLVLVLGRSVAAAPDTVVLRSIEIIGADGMGPGAPSREALLDLELPLLVTENGTAAVYEGLIERNFRVRELVASSGPRAARRIDRSVVQFLMQRFYREYETRKVTDRDHPVEVSVCDPDLPALDREGRLVVHIGRVSGVPLCTCLKRPRPDPAAERERVARACESLVGDGKCACVEDEYQSLRGDQRCVTFDDLFQQAVKTCTNAGARDSGGGASAARATTPFSGPARRANSDAGAASEGSVPGPSAGSSEPAGRASQRPAGRRRRDPAVGVGAGDSAVERAKSGDAAAPARGCDALPKPEACRNEPGCLMLLERMRERCGR